MDQVTPSMEPYVYPPHPHKRRHGPAGYASHKEYRRWLEDDFIFRCVYCLKRMVWAPTDIWAVDHLVPQEEAPELACQYDNLVLACQFCNTLKSSHRVPDPCIVAYGSCLRMESTGVVTPLNKHGKRLVDTIRLNHHSHVEEREKWIRALHLLAQHDPVEFERLMGFPGNLPNLTKLRPPAGNRRPDGVFECYFAKRERGALPKTY